MRGIVIGRFGNKSESIYFRAVAVAVALNDLLSTGAIFLRFRLRRGVAIASLRCKIPFTLFSWFRNFSFLSKIRNVVLKQNATTWANTDNRLRPNAFRKHSINRAIAIHASGWSDDIIDFLVYLTEVSGDCLKANISGLQDLMSMRRIDHKSGPLADRFLRFNVCEKIKTKNTSKNRKVSASPEEFV